MNEPSKRDAVIFVPGLGGAGESASTIATRISYELRRLSRGNIEVKVSPESEARYGAGLTTKMASISPSSTTDMPSIDVYFYNYRENLTTYEKGWNPLVKAFFLVLTMLSCWLTFLKAVISPRKSNGISKKDAFQILCGIAVLFILFLGTVAALLILSLAIAEAVKNNNLGGGRWLNFTKDAMAILIPILGAVGLSSSSFGSAVAASSEKVVAMMHYLAVGNRKGAITGPLEDLILHVSHGNYDALHIVAYSFGSIVTLDTVFPKGEDRTGQHFQSISSLVSIGCPFDVIRYYYPRYFEERHPAIATSTRRINIYSPADVLSSNFRNDAEELAAEVSIGTVDTARKPENFSYIDAVGADKFTFITAFLMMGLRAHAMYWEKTPSSEVSCFRLVLETLFRQKLAA